MHLGKYDDHDDRSDRWPVFVLSLRSFTVVTIAEAIAGIEPDPISAIAIVTIVGMVNSVSI